jgi:hypothetical protein
MRHLKVLSFSVMFFGVLALASSEARADDATITIGAPDDPPPQMHTARPPTTFVADDGFVAREPELRRSPFRLTLAPMGITTGKGLGYGVGLGADFGTGSVGGRLAAAWLRGEGTTASGASTPTGSSVGHYTGEITLDLHKRGPVHPVFGMGAGFLHVSRPDGKSGFAGTGTGRFAVEYALGLDDADVRVGASLTGGVIGPIDDEIKDLKAYALGGVHVAIGF